MFSSTSYLASHALAGSFVRAPSRAEPLQYLLRVYCWVFSLSKVEALTICLFIYGSPLFYTFIIIPTNRFSDECQVQRVNHILPSHGIHPFIGSYPERADPNAYFFVGRALHKTQCSNVSCNILRTTGFLESRQMV